MGKARKSGRGTATSDRKHEINGQSPPSARRGLLHEEATPEMA